MNAIPNRTTSPVLIVGAGCSGLATALEMTRQGQSVRIIDRALAPTTESRGTGLQARTLELLSLYGLLISRASAVGASWVVVEIADGLLQCETAALLQHPGFATSVDAWVFAAGDPLAAAGGVGVLRSWGIEPLAISGVVSMSPLGMRETQTATQLTCLSASELQCGALNARLQEIVPKGAPLLFRTAGRGEGLSKT